ncbi:MAG: hypothetical protein JWQ38_2117 [Flavipsychrobacter sp.]|nr:hypothetical protein [Flavipsychrobacter sp.]
MALFLLCVFTLEIFYIIPFFLITIALYYRYALNYDKQVFRKTMVNFVAPQLLLLAIYFIALYATYKNLHVHKIELHESALTYLSKLPKYLYHIVFLGRFFATEDKHAVYTVLESSAAIIAFYTLVVIGSGYVLVKFNKLSTSARTMFLLFVWAMMTLAFVMPLSFPDHSLLIFYDRYTYFANAFVYMLVVMLALKLKNRYIAYGIFVIYAGLNLYFTTMVNGYWKTSDIVNTRLLNNLPETGNKKVLLLNIPENMNGAPMIGAQADGEYKTMHEVYTGIPLKNQVIDVASYNMTTDTDGVYITVINDTTIDIALNQWGSWWWYEGHGAKNYETADYSLTMINKGRAYRLVLKQPAESYALLYEVGDKWKAVDMTKKNGIQK